MMSPFYFYAVVNESIVVFTGEPVRVREDVQVTMNCSKLIDRAINDGVSNPTVTWFKDNLVLSNDSRTNVLISADNRLCIITNTALTYRREVGNDGNYSCEVCRNTTDCMIGSNFVYVCRE